MLELWENSGDEFLVQLRKDYLKVETIPTIDEASDMLGFLLSFSVGCQRLGITPLVKSFKVRSDLYAVVLEHMGYVGGWRSTGKFSRDRGTLDKIVARACGCVRLDYIDLRE